MDKIDMFEYAKSKMNEWKKWRLTIEHSEGYIKNVVLHRERDYKRWQNRIVVTLERGRIAWEDNINAKKILRETFKDRKVEIEICVKILKKLDKGKYLVRLFDDIFVMKLAGGLKRIDWDWNKRMQYWWGMTYSGLYGWSVHAKLYEVDDVMLLTKVL